MLVLCWSTDFCGEKMHGAVTEGEVGTSFMPTACTLFRHAGVMVSVWWESIYVWLRRMPSRRESLPFRRSNDPVGIVRSDESGCDWDRVGWRQTEDEAKRSLLRVAASTV